MSNCPTYTVFKGVSNISNDFLLNNLESNFKDYLNWAFLNIGGWFDVNMPSSGIYGGHPHSTLIRVSDRSYDDNTVYQTIRKEIVWESGVDFNDASPIDVSGVYVNNVFVPIESGIYHINYPLGQVVFEDPLNNNDTVKMNYSYRYVQVARSIDSEWFDRLQFATFDTNNPDITRYDDGTWNIFGSNRIQMPCIIVESVAKRTNIPFEIGNDNQLIRQDIVLHILAENKQDRNKLLDILGLQQDGVIILYNTQLISQNEQYPLDINGSPITGALNYPDLVLAYPWRKCWIKNVNLFEKDNITPGLYEGTARFTVEIISE